MVDGRRVMDLAIFSGNVRCNGDTYMYVPSQSGVNVKRGRQDKQHVVDSVEV